MSIFLVSFCKLATQAWCTFFREKKVFIGRPIFLYTGGESPYSSHILCERKEGKQAPFLRPLLFYQTSDNGSFFRTSEEKGKVTFAKKI